MRGGRIGSRVGNQQEGKERGLLGVEGFSIKKKNLGPLVIELHEKDPPFSFFLFSPSSYTLSSLLPRSSSSLITIAAADLCMCEHACVCARMCVCMGGGQGRAV